MEALPLAWKEKKEINIPEALHYEYDLSELKKLSQLERADISTTISDMVKLHTQLRKLAEKLNSLISPMPTFFILEDIPKPPAFIWFDMEHLKGSLISFIIFWTATLLWIFVNPPGGFTYIQSRVAVQKTIKVINDPLRSSMSNQRKEEVHHEIERIGWYSC